MSHSDFSADFKLTPRNKQSHTTKIQTRPNTTTNKCLPHLKLGDDTRVLPHFLEEYRHIVLCGGVLHDVVNTTLAGTGGLVTCLREPFMQEVAYEAEGDHLAPHVGEEEARSHLAQQQEGVLGRRPIHTPEEGRSVRGYETRE